jgi:CBS-domain-containing membrane protein
LNAAVQTEVVTLSWRYLPTILASSLIMLGWALFINNLGRRRYPVYWWQPESIWIAKKVDENPAREDEVLAMEEGGLRREEDEVETSNGDSSIRGAVQGAIGNKAAQTP